MDRSRRLVLGVAPTLFLSISKTYPQTKNHPGSRASRSWFGTQSHGLSATSRLFRGWLSRIPMGALAASAMTQPTPEDRSDPNAIDVALMFRAGKGDHAAFQELVERHQQAVVGTVAKMLGNASEAEDISQQVFIRLWKSAARYTPTAKFTTYLFTITRNLVFNETRKRQRRKTHSLDEQEDAWHKQLAEPEEGQPDVRMLQGELRSAVDAAIASLPEKQRLAVVLRRYEQMPYEEIAEVLELTVSAVKSQLFRARTTLRELLERFLEE
jgi:RNA polymerase sigma-70 factor, ECF subfamily